MSRGHTRADSRASDASGTRARGRKPRVLIVGPSLDILGGQAVQAARLFAKLQKESSLDVAFLPINPRLPGPLRKLQAVKYLRTLVTSLLYVATLIKEIPRYDVIHIFSASYLSFVIAPTPAILISKLARKKIVLNYHSGEAADHLLRWKSARRTIRLVDEIAVPSRYLADVFKRFGFQSRPIYNFIDTTLFRFRERSPFRPVFLSNRNLEPMYNVACVIRAFAIISRRCPEARLIIAGDGSERAALESLVSSLHLDNVTFLGQVAPQDMPELYDSADVFLNASEIDNMPLSIIEAFASGLPVVTTDAGGIPYIVTNEVNGLLVECRDHEALASSAIRLVEEDGVASRVAGKARLDCESYTWPSVREEWLALYFDLRREAEQQKNRLAAFSERC